MQTYSLLQLNQAIKDTLKKTYPVSLWVKAEIHGITTNYTGHCYLDLIEKSPQGDQIIAKQRATIWSSVYRVLSDKFQITTGQTLKAGLKILVEVSVEFHELYGMSLNVKNIDPTYTLGDLQKRRLEIIERLKKRGLIGKNKQLSMPILPQKIAVISSPTAAGYNDFIHQLTNNQYGFYYSTTLFSAIMQGNQTEESIISALFEIQQKQEDFDIVVIIRGGGATSDLQAFDSELLAEKCANFPLPILSGIGHLRDESIIDMVAYASLKTPTAVAEYIISITIKLAVYLEDIGEKINKSVTIQLEREKNRLMAIMQSIPKSALRLLTDSKLKLGSISHKIDTAAIELINRHKNKISEIYHIIAFKTTGLIEQHRTMLDKQEIKMNNTLVRRFEDQRSRLELIDTKIKLLDPKNILRKGYSFTVKEGKIITTSATLKEGDKLTTTFADGEIKSIVTKQ